MAQEFDFNSVGKRMPYTVPEGFFEELEQNVRQKLNWQDNAAAPVKSSKHRVARLWPAGLAAAAAVVLAFVFTDKTAGTDFADVEQAFCNLNADDQAYVLSVYQDDIFMTQQTD